MCWAFAVFFPHFSGGLNPSLPEVPVPPIFGFHEIVSSLPLNLHIYFLLLEPWKQSLKQST
jgi:hypothetical protein